MSGYFSGFSIRSIVKSTSRSGQRRCCSRSRFKWNGSCNSAPLTREYSRLPGRIRVPLQRAEPMRRNIQDLNAGSVSSMISACLYRAAERACSIRSCSASSRRAAIDSIEYLPEPFTANTHRRNRTRVVNSRFWRNSIVEKFGR